MDGWSAASNDEALLLAAFRAAADEPFFADIEFDSIMGLSRDDLRRLLDEWPSVIDERLLDLAITNVVANLTGHAHENGDQWRRYSHSDPGDLLGLGQRWHAGSHPAPQSMAVFLHGDDEQTLDDWIEGYFRHIRILSETPVSETDATAGLDEAGYDGGLFDWLTEAMNYGAPDGPERAWPVITQLVACAPDDRSLGIIGAGPLEDLVRNHGYRFALRLIERTASDPNFRTAMQHVWFGNTPSWLRQRLETLRGEPL